MLDSSAIGMKTQCAATTADGNPCPNAALSGGQFCFTHDPAKAAERDAARNRGGAARAAQLSGAVVEKLDSPEAVRLYLTRVCRDVEAGLIEPKRGTAISNLARIQLQALKYEAAVNQYESYWFCKV